MITLNLGSGERKIWLFVESTMFLIVLCVLGEQLNKKKKRKNLHIDLVVAWGWSFH